MNEEIKIRKTQNGIIYSTKNYFLLKIDNKIYAKHNKISGFDYIDLIYGDYQEDVKDFLGVNAKGFEFMIKTKDVIITTLNNKIF